MHAMHPACEGGVVLGGGGLLGERYAQGSARRAPRQHVLAVDQIPIDIPKPCRVLDLHGVARFEVVRRGG
eukprot:5790793-Pleurochrysis_carterae.AAC.1